MFGQYGDLPENQRQLAVVVVLELEQHPQRIFGDHFRNVGIVAAVKWGAVLDQHVEGEHHVLGAYWVAVVEAGFRAQVEAHPAVVRGLFDLLCQQAVFAERFVQAGAGQGVVDQVEVVRRDALVDEWV